MKKIFLALATFASMSAFAADALAIEVNKGRVVSHKEWTTGQVKSTLLKQMTAKEIALKIKSFHKADIYSFGYVASTIDSGESPATVGSYTEINGFSVALVENNSNETKHYAVTSQVCAVDEPCMHCSFYYDEIELETGGSFKRAISPVVAISFNQAGKHDILALTDLVIGLDSNQEHILASQSISSINVGEALLAK